MPRQAERGCKARRGGSTGNEGCCPQGHTPAAAHNPGPPAASPAAHPVLCAPQPGVIRRPSGLGRLWRRRTAGPGGRRGLTARTGAGELGTREPGARRPAPARRGLGAGRGGLGPAPGASEGEEPRPWARPARSPARPPGRGSRQRLLPL